jgi:hypothetical protein
MQVHKGPGLRKQEIRRIPKEAVVQLKKKQKLMDAKDLVSSPNYRTLDLLTSIQLGSRTYCARRQLDCLSGTGKAWANCNSKKVRCSSFLGEKTSAEIIILSEEGGTMLRPKEPGHQECCRRQGQSLLRSES